MSEFLRVHDLRRGAIEFVPDFEMTMTTGGMRSVGGESRYDVTDCHCLASALASSSSFFRRLRLARLTENAMSASTLIFAVVHTQSGISKGRSMLGSQPKRISNSQPRKRPMADSRDPSGSSIRASQFMTGSRNGVRCRDSQALTG